MPRNTPIKIRGAGDAPAAAVSIEDVRRAFYEAPGVPPTYWIAEMQLSPPQLIVADDATSNLYRVPLTIKGSDITFGAPVEVQRVFTDMAAPAKTAASRGPARDNEAIIAAAVSAGRIPASRAAYWRAAASKGVDLAVLDTLAAAPGLGQHASAAEDAEDAAYRALFGGTPGSGPRAVSAAQASDDAVYDYMFGARPDEPDPAAYKALFPAAGQRQAAGDARAAARAKAVAALSDDELWDELGFNRGGSK